MSFDFHSLFEIFLVVLTAVPRTLGLAAIILFLGILGGSLLTVISRKNFLIINKGIDILSSYLRGVPMLIHLFIVRNTLPDFLNQLMISLGMISSGNLSFKFTVIFVTYGIYQTFIEFENIRGAVKSINYNQVEAGLSIGLTPLQVFRRLVLHELAAYLTPIFINSFLKIIKGLSLAFAVGVVDILAQARYQGGSTYRYLESYIAASLIYWLVCGGLYLLINRVKTIAKRRTI